MTQCKVCIQDLPEEKFGNSYHTLSDGIKKAYKDSTCMMCRRKKHLENPDKRQIHRDGTRNWYRDNPDKAKGQRLRQYGITLEEYDNLREAQEFCCAVCKRHEEKVEQGRATRTSYALCVDHCHTTRKVRGLLCTNCNTLLGKAKDDIVILTEAIKYLKGLT